MSKDAAPILKDWEIHLLKDDIHRDDVVKSFASFYQMNLVGIIQRLPGKCRLRGAVYGHKKFEDGTSIFTDDIKSMKRVKYHHAKIRHDLLCITTWSGEKFYLYTDEHDRYTTLMLGDVTYTGELRHLRYCDL